MRSAILAPAVILALGLWTGAARADCTPTPPSLPEQAAFPDDLEARDAAGEAAYAAKDYAAAEPIFRDLMAQTRTRLGPTHQKSLEAIYDLGLTVFQRYEVKDRRFAESLVLLKAYAEGESRLLGEAHALSGSAWLQLARARKAAGDAVGAAEAAARAGAIFDVAVCPTGEKAILALTLRVELADGSDLPLAAALYRDLYRRRITLAPDDRAALMTGHVAARVAQTVKDLATAEVLYREVVPRLATLFGDDDPDTLTARRNLGVLLDAQGRRAEAEPLFQAVVESRRRTAGADDPATLAAEVELAEVLSEQDKWASAEALYRHVLILREQTPGIDPELLEDPRNQIARLLRKQNGRTIEAVTFARAVYESRIRRLGLAHQDTENAAYLLAVSLSDAGHEAEALPLLQQVLNQRIKRDGPDAVATADVRQWVGDTLYALKRYPEALVQRRLIYQRLALLMPPGDEAVLSAGRHLALVLVRTGDVAGGRALAEAGQKAAIAAHGADSQEALTASRRLAVLLQETRDWPAAAAAWRSVSAAATRTKGPGAIEVARATYELGKIAQEQFRFVEAEAQFRQAAAAFRVSVGPDDGETLTALGGVAKMLDERGHHAEAIEIYTQIVASRRRVEGEGTAGALASQWNLAISLFDAGREAEGLALLRTAREGLILLNGPDSEAAWIASGNLATALVTQGQIDEGLAMVQRALAAAVRAQGPVAQVSLTLRLGLVAGLSEAGRLDEALREVRTLVADDTSVYGPEAAQTLVARNNLAQLLVETGGLAEAERMDRDTLAIRRRVLGPDHPDTIASLNNLATGIGIQDRFAEAEGLQREAVALAIKVLGPAHPSTLNYLSNLGATLQFQGRRTETLHLGREAYEIAQANLGVEHPQTLKLASNYAAVLSNTDAAAAEALQAKTYAAMVRVLGVDHPATIALLGNWSVALSRLGRHEESAARSRQVLEQRRRVLGPGHPDTLLAANHVAADLARGKQWREVADLLGDSVARQRRREVENPGERLLTAALQARRALGQAQIELGEARDAYQVYGEAAAAVRRRYGDRRIQRSENASGMMKGYAEVFTGQVRAGWALAHQP